MHAVDPNRAMSAVDPNRVGALIAYARCGVLWFATDDPELVTCARCRLEMVEAAIASLSGKVTTRTHDFLLHPEDEP